MGELRWSKGNMEYAISLLSAVGRNSLPDLLILMSIVERYVQKKNGQFLVTNSDIHSSIFHTEDAPDAWVGLLEDLKHG
jgi:hypothetical protein